MRFLKRFIAGIKNLFKIKILFISEYHYSSIFPINAKTCLVFLSISLLSLGGVFRTLLFLTNQANSYITVSFQLKKNHHYKSLVDALNHLLDQSICLVHQLPCSTGVIPKKLTIIPEFVSNSSLFPLMTPSTVEQLLKAYDLKYNLQPSTPVKHNSTSDLSVFGCPTEGRITSHFGKRTDPVFEGTAIHYGIDIASLVGTPVLATANGRVKYVGNKTHWGNVIIIDHAKGYQTVYAHLHKFGVCSGDTVSKGQMIGYLGNTGKSTGPHLHYEIRYFGKPLNPLPFLLPLDIIAD
jgi:murein DD-endopeptidase MepM/ murein hydrolase activator NlpD